MRYSKGVMWLDDCRIPFDIKKETPTGDMYYLINDKKYPNQETSSSKIMGSKTKRVDLTFTQGRFTPNLLVCDDMLNDGVITNSSGHIRNNKKTQTIYGGGKGFPPIKVDTAPNDKRTNSRYYDLDLWFDKIINNL